MILITSCKEKIQEDNYNTSKISLGDFESEKLNGKIISIDNSIEFSGILTLDTLLLMKTSSKHKEYFKIYNTQNCDFLGDIGERGEAPHQWKFVVTNDLLTKNDNEYHIWVSDRFDGYLKQVNINKSLDSENELPIYNNEYSINANLFPFNRVYALDGYLIGDTGYEDESFSRFKKMDLETKEIEYIPFFPKIKDFQKIPAPVLYNIYVGALKKHPNKNIFVSTPSTFNRIDFLNDNLEVYKSIVDGDNWKDNYYDANEIDIASDQTYEMQDGHHSTNVTENYIFTRYRNISKEIDGRQNKEESMIKVLDWEGNPIKLLYLDCDAFTFAYNEKLKTLFVVDIVNEHILTYNLNGVLP